MISRRVIVTAEAPTDKRKAIVEALMDLASRRAWHEIDITDVAKAANVSLAEFRDLFPSKGAVRERATISPASPRANASSMC